MPLDSNIGRTVHRLGAMDIEHLGVLGPHVYAEDPQAGDVYSLGWTRHPVVFVQVRGITNVGTVTFNIERRVITTPLTVGTDILSADLVAAVGGALTTAFADNGAVAEDQWIVATITSVATSPAQLWIPYTID